MPRHTRTLILALAALWLLTSVAAAQIYAGDRNCGCIYSYVDTVASVVSPVTLDIDEIGGLALDHQGHVLISGHFRPSAYVARLDPDTEDFELLFPQTQIPNYAPIAIAPDEGTGIYVLMMWAGSAGSARSDPTPDDFVAFIADGADTAVVAYTFAAGLAVKDMKVRPQGTNEGNVVVMVRDDEGGGHLFIELEPTGEGNLLYVQSIADGGMMPSTPTAFAFSPDGMITLVDETDGLYYVDEDYGYVWSFGSAGGPGLEDIAIDSGGYIYLANMDTDRVRRYTSAGAADGPAFGYDLTSLQAITVAGYAPTPVGDFVLVEPWENVEVTFEGVTQSGFTTAVVETTSSRTSPGAGNYLPSYASLPSNAGLPGSRADHFTYVSLATDAVYEDVIQVDVLLEGSRLFFASGYGDTFRDFTVVGSIEDARGTIPRFTEFPAPLLNRADSDPTEVVLVEDSRTLSEVTAYKFWRLELAMTYPDTVSPCPWGAIHGLKEYVSTARAYYDAEEYSSAIYDLAYMNSALRDYAGWCIPNSSASEVNNIVGKILGHSKTLMFSIDLESWVGIEEAPSAVALSAANPGLGECVMALSGPVGTEVAVKLYDVSGRLVSTLYEGSVPEGGTSVVWDGKDSSGHRAASGVYFARAEANGEYASSKVVYLK